MNKRPEETHAEWLARMAELVKGMTQDQVDACAYVMGGSGCGWTPNTLSEELKRCSEQSERLGRF